MFLAQQLMRGLAKERTQRWPTMAALVSELTPPVAHARGRTAAVAMVGVIVLGVAAAAVMASHRPQMITTDGPDSETIRVLVDQINILETQVKQDRKQLLERDLLHDTDVKQIEHDKEQLLEKETRIQALVEQVTKIRLEKVLPKSTTQGGKVIGAVPSAQRDLEGCFDEWSSRPLTAEAVGSADALHRANDSDVVVTLEIGPDGKARNANSKGDDSDRSPSLKLCVEGALAGIAYPTGPEVIEIEVSVAWVAPNLINTSARVTGHHEPSAP